MHLREQMLDFGPPAGWWCFGYERANGLISRVPGSRSAAALSTGRRAMELLQIASKIPRLPDELLPTPAGAGFAHCIRPARHDNGRRHVYEFTTDAAGDLARRNLHEWRHCADIVEEEEERKESEQQLLYGCEPWPGQLFEVHADKLQLNRANDSHQEKALLGSAFRSGRSVSELTTSTHARDCVWVFYLKRYQDDMLRTIAPEVRKSKRRTEIELMPIPDQLEQPEVQTWLDSVVSEATVFGRLHLAGETYGSACAESKGTGSYICVWFCSPQQPVRFPHFGRVCYYLQHTYGGRLYSFAVTRWFDYVGQRNARGGARSLTLMEAMKHKYKGKDAYAIAAFKDTFHSFPVVTTEFTKGTTTDDMVPVHRIACRWVPVPLPSDPKHQFACALPTRTH
jgi:hypothetical protein